MFFRTLDQFGYRGALWIDVGGSESDVPDLDRAFLVAAAVLERRRSTMHEGERPIDEAFVARLLTEQMPQFAHLPVRAVQSTGTVNALFRLGDDLVVRLPRLPRFEESLARELVWLPKLAARLSLRVPEPVAAGRPTSGFACAWAVFRWLDGVVYGDGVVADERVAARTLARLVRELAAMGVDDGPPAGRQPLQLLDVDTRLAIEDSRGVFDAMAALASWDRALEAPGWVGAGRWIHGDLMRPNLLVREGRLDAAIDFGGTGVGDPAMDLVAGWSVFGPVGRAAFHDALAGDGLLDGGAWARARGYALHQAALIVPYYAESNPAFAAEAVRIVGEVLRDDV